MRRVFLLFLILFAFISKTYAFEIIYPTDKKSIVNSDYAFFVGHASPSEDISINGSSVYTAPNGAFAYSVKLKEGENRIMIRSNYYTQFYKVYKNTIKNKEFPVEPFDTRKIVVNCDNTPLRSTPVDAGLNRIAHLFAGTTLIADASKGNFYRVFLSKDKTAWIAKKDVTFLNEDTLEPAKFIGMNTKRFKNASMQSISFSKKLPYTVEEKEDEIVFRVYNPELSEDSVYNLSMPKPENKKYTYTVNLSEDGEYTFKIRQLPKSLKECTIAIDAGHGGTERGAVGCLGDDEKDINLKIAQELQKQLSKTGATVVMTRDYDCNISLNDRIDTARTNGTDIFISIHLNSIGNTSMNIHKNRGTSIFYFNDNSKELAKILEESISSSADTRKDGVKGASFAVIRPTDYVGVLVEAAYMTNPLDSMIYLHEDFPHNVSKGIVDGLKNFIKQKK